MMPVSKPCFDGTVLTTKSQCQAAFNQMAPQLPPHPPPRFNPCCDPTDNLPYGCTYRSDGDNDFLFNSNANASPTTQQGRTAVCATAPASVPSFLIDAS